MNSQLKKGVIETCVLALLNRKDFYGYELVESISKHVEITEGTIYPLLRRLKDTNIVDTYLIESQSGPPRKYYRLTNMGKKEAVSQIKQYQDFTKGVLNLISGGNHE